MQLPHTTTSDPIFILDPSEKFINRDAAGNVLSVIDRHSGRLITPGAAAPTWKKNIINEQPVFNFDGTQSLKFSFPNGAITNGTKNPLVITCLAQATSFGSGDNTIQDLGSATLANPGMSLDFTTASFLQVYRYDDAAGLDGSSTASPPTSTAFHVYTGIYDSVNIILRVDGIEIRKTAATNGTGHFTGDQLSIGDYTDGSIGSFGHGYFRGNIGMMIVYYGTVNAITNSVQPPVEVESYLKQLYGL